MVSKPTTITVEAPKMDESTSIKVTMEPNAKADEALTESTSHEAISKDATNVIVEAMTSKIILMMPKNQELSKFQRISSQKASRIKI